MYIIAQHNFLLQINTPVCRRQVSHDYTTSHHDLQQFPQVAIVAMLPICNSHTHFISWNFIPLCLLAILVNTSNRDYWIWLADICNICQNQAHEGFPTPLGMCAQYRELIVSLPVIYILCTMTHIASNSTETITLTILFNGRFLQNLIPLVLIVNDNFPTII